MLLYIFRVLYVLLFVNNLQGGDKLTLSLGGASNGTSGNLTTNTEKLINLDPITPSEPTKLSQGGSSQKPPAPPPRISSDPNNPINLNKKLQNGDINDSATETLPVSVTHFSPSVNGFGLEKETIFTDENGGGMNDKEYKASPKSFGKTTKNTNPFLSSPGSSPENDNPAMFRSQSRKDNNYENVNIEAFSNDNGTTNNPFTSGKFNTIGRSNPFSSAKGSSFNRSNPFIDLNGSSCGDRNVSNISTDSPDASIDPTPILQPAVLKQDKEKQNNVNGGILSGIKINTIVSTFKIEVWAACQTFFRKERLIIKLSV